MSWRDPKGKWHGTPAYLGGAEQPTDAERRKYWPKRQTQRRPDGKQAVTARSLAEISRRQMASLKR